MEEAIKRAVDIHNHTRYITDKHVNYAFDNEFMLLRLLRLLNLCRYNLDDFMPKLLDMSIDKFRKYFPFFDRKKLFKFLYDSDPNSVDYSRKLSLFPEFLCNYPYLSSPAYCKNSKVALAFYYAGYSVHYEADKYTTLEDFKYACDENIIYAHEYEDIPTLEMVKYYLKKHPRDIFSFVRCMVRKDFRLVFKYLQDFDQDIDEVIYACIIDVGVAISVFEKFGCNDVKKIFEWALFEEHNSFVVHFADEYKDIIRDIYDENPNLYKDERIIKIISVGKFSKKAED